MENRQFTGEQREFLGIIRRCRRRMNAAQIWEKLAAAVAVGALFGIGFEAAAFILPFYYVNVYAVLALAVSAVTALAAAYRCRVSEASAALKIDSFGFEERVVTAYEGMMKKDVPISSRFFDLQQRDAMRRLQAGKDRIKIAVFPSAKKMGLCIGLLAVLAVLALAPSVMKERAKELHAIRMESKEKQEEIREVTQELEKLEEITTGDLTEEQKVALQEMIKSLQSSSAEYAQAASSKELAAAGQKLDYKYMDMSAQLEELAQSLLNGAEASSMAASTIQEVSRELQSMSGGSGGEGQAGSPSGNGQEGDGGDGQEGSQNGSQNGNDPNGNNDPNNNDQNDESKNGNGQNGSPSENGQNGNENGQGNSGNGGSGNGQGGNGDGGQSDGSPGNGRGTGTANIQRDYISVPNEVGNDDTLTGQAGSSQTSEGFKAQNGLSWEGDHVDYDSVIGAYQQKAYEGISGGKYPSGMEDVIKEYFGSFNE